jgi:hypothetical protein
MQSTTFRMRTLPPALRDALETAEMVVQDLARQVVEGTASLAELDAGRALFRQILDVARAYLRNAAERDLFAFPRTTHPVAPVTH